MTNYTPKPVRTNRDGYKNYPPEVVLKRVFKYIWKSKFIIIASLLFLIIYTILELVQPVMVSRLIDDHLTGVQTVWVETTGTEDVASFNGKTYTKLQDREPGDAPVITITYYEDDYFYLEGAFKNYHIVNVENNVATVEITNADDVIESTNAMIYRLSAQDLEHFYEPSINPIIIIIVIYGVLTIFIIIFRYLQTIFFQTASMKLTLDMRAEAFQKLNRLPMKYFTREPSGKIVTKITSDTEGVRGLYQVIFSIVSAVISLVMVYIFLFGVNWKLALITLCATPVILVWMTLYRNVNNKYHHRIREMNSIINASLAQYVDGMSIVQQFNKEEQMTNEYDGLLKKNYRNKMTALKINSIFGRELLVLIQDILIAIVIFYFGRTFLDGDTAVTAGIIYLYVSVVTKVIDPIREIFVNLNAMEDAFVASSRIFEFMDHDEDKYLGFNKAPKIKGKVSLEHLTFAYDEKNVLEDVNIQANPGDFIGIVGHTGSGKSTLMTILGRFYDLQEGRVLLDDVDFMEYTKQEVRSNIGYVLQEPAIFSGNIRDNIAFGKEATDEEIENVLKMIGATKFVDSFEKGIYTELEYLGSNLSTGEKQLISFARILLRNPSIIILDEATANIDSETESLIQHALSVLAKGRTTFVIAHRLSTIRYADNIYVLQDGRVVESGKHDDLYNRNGAYRKIYDAQYRE